MKIAIGSDMNTQMVQKVVEKLREMGHQVHTYGALVETPVMWSKVAIEVAEQVAMGAVDQAVLFCWTGTGISLAANKVPGIRAALCLDAETAKGARLWNDANILAMSIRSTSEAVALEILEAWFSTDTSPDQEDVACLDFLRAAEKKYRQM